MFYHKCVENEKKTRGIFFNTLVSMTKLKKYEREREMLEHLFVHYQQQQQQKSLHMLGVCVFSFLFQTFIKMVF